MIIVWLELDYKIWSSTVNKIYHNELLDHFSFNILFQIAMLPRISFLTDLMLYKTEEDMDLYLKARWKWAYWPKYLDVTFMLEKK